MWGQHVFPLLLPLWDWALTDRLKNSKHTDHWSQSFTVFHTNLIHVLMESHTRPRSTGHPKLIIPATSTKCQRVCYWYFKISQCGCMAHGWKYIQFYVQKHIAPRAICYNPTPTHTHKHTHTHLWANSDLNHWIFMYTLNCGLNLFQTSHSRLPYIVCKTATILFSHQRESAPSKPLKTFSSQRILNQNYLLSTMANNNVCNPEWLYRN